MNTLSKWFEGIPCEYPVEMVGQSKDLPRCSGKPCCPHYQGLFANTPPIWLGQCIEYPAGACSPQKLVAKGII